MPRSRKGKWSPTPAMVRARKKWAGEHGREYYLKRNYELPVEAFEILAQHGCQICGGAENLSVDHDHASGRVRGVLCRHCNLMLGHAKDSADRLLLGAQYLRRGQ